MLTVLFVNERQQINENAVTYTVCCLSEQPNSGNGTVENHLLTGTHSMSHTNHLSRISSQDLSNSFNLSMRTCCPSKQSQTERHTHSRKKIHRPFSPPNTNPSTMSTCIRAHTHTHRSRKKLCPFSPPSTDPSTLDLVMDMMSHETNITQLVRLLASPRQQQNWEGTTAGSFFQTTYC